MDFNDALEQAKAFSLNNLQHIEEDIYLIRDLQGRIRILLKKEKAAKAVQVQDRSICVERRSAFCRVLGVH